MNNQKVFNNERRIFQFLLDTYSEGVGKMKHIRFFKENPDLLVVGFELSNASIKERTHAGFFSKDLGTFVDVTDGTGHFDDIKVPRRVRNAASNVKSTLEKSIEKYALEQRKDD